jgi:hypothetical protein
MKGDRGIWPFSLFHKGRKRAPEPSRSVPVPAAPPVFEQPLPGVVIDEQEFARRRNAAGVREASPAYEQIRRWRQQAEQIAAIFSIPFALDAPYPANEFFRILTSRTHKYEKDREIGFQIPGGEEIPFIIWRAAVTVPKETTIVGLVRISDQEEGADVHTRLIAVKEDGSWQAMEFMKPDTKWKVGPTNQVFRGVGGIDGSIQDFLHEKYYSGKTSAIAITDYTLVNTFAPVHGVKPPEDIV